MKLIIATGDGVYPNNTMHITGMTVIGGMLWLVISASVAGEAAARDVQMRIHPLIYTSPVSKFNYLGGRFIAAFAINALLVLALPLGLMLSFYAPFYQLFPGAEQESLLPFRPLAYLNVYFLIALPTAFFGTAFQFTFSALNRRVTTAYIASLLIAMFPQIVAAPLVKLFGNWELVKLLDPIGLAGILSAELPTWSVADKNTRLLTLDGMFFLNRILWTGVAAGVLWLTYMRFSFSVPRTSSLFSQFKKSKKVQPEDSSKIAIRSTAISIPQVRISFGYATRFRQALRIASASFKMIATHPLGLTIVGLMSLVSAGFGEYILNEFGVPLIPTTQQVVTYLAAPVNNMGSPWVIIPILIIYFAGQLIWRERDSRLSEIADAAPATDGVLLAGKFLGLSLIIVVWVALLTMGGIVMQLAMGYNKVELHLYLQVLFGFQLVDYMLFAVLVFVIHVVVNQKYIGLLVALLVLAFMSFASNFGIEHSMLIYNADPGWSYSDMRGYGTSFQPWFWFKAYWSAWALLLAVAAKLLWPRGKEQGFSNRILAAKRRFAGATKWAAIIGVGLLLGLASFIFYNTNVLNEYLTHAGVMRKKADYESLYGKYRNIPQPQLVGTKLHIELYPNLQQADIDATYTLVNKDTVAISTIHLGSPSGVNFSQAKFSRPASAVMIDKELSHHIYALVQPLKPGDSVHLRFKIHYKQEGFQHLGCKPLVVKDGTHFTNYDLLPAIGYQLYREINNAADRKKHNLFARPALPSLYDVEASKKPFSTDQTALDIIIGTVKDEVAVAPGALERSWTEAGRKYFHYKTNSSIGGEYRILSADYAVKESKWNNVAIRVCYHRGHGKNIDKMLHSVKISLAYYTEQFGPYPYKYFTLIESAGPGNGASADAGIVYYGEQYPLLNPDGGPDSFDLPYYIIAHEMAHQWWGLARLAPAYVEGAGVLIEGLAVYSGMQVLKKRYGEGHLSKYIDFLHSSYAIPRSLASAPLIQANEEFLYYRKGGLAMYALSEYVGEKNINAALRNLLKKKSNGELHAPTTVDLLKEIKKVTPDSLQYLVQDLFYENTYWRLKTDHIGIEKSKKDEWEVTLKVRAQKVIVDSNGAEKEVKMTDWLQIGLYEKGNDLMKPLYLKMHRIRSGQQTIKIIVPRKPVIGGIDPNNLMIDLRREDNNMHSL
jgi:ABC-type transport system involved in multi-copper enzyme maturation permease subunit